MDFGILGVDFSGILPIIGRKQTAENILLEQESFYNLFGVDKFVFGTFLATFYLNKLIIDFTIDIFFHKF